MSAAAPIFALLALAASQARAEADPHDGMIMDDGRASAFDAGVSVIAAQYGPTPFFVGDYEGVTPMVGWKHDVWSASAMLGFYRLDENGLVVYGPGDLMVAGGVTVLRHCAWRGGVAVEAMLPTGAEALGLGMGHVMAMPSAWLSRNVWRLVVRASAGYNRALTSLDGHVHGLWPLVEPMNLQEVSWSVGAAAPAIWRNLDVSASVWGGVPIDVPMGVDRASAGVKASWTEPRVVTALELQVGVLGDPYVVRALVSTMVRL